MRIGIDLGGSKIEIIVLDESGNVHLRQRTATPDSYEQRLTVIADMVGQAEADLALDTATVGIGTPGAISARSGLIKNSNSVCLNGRAFKEDIESLLQRPVLIANDANCFALSEAVDGAAEGAASVFAVILGTGVGGGLVINGHIHSGINSIAGEWGHNPMPWPKAGEWPGLACYCGRTGCIETLLSGPGMSADHLRYSDQQVDSKAIVEMAEQADGQCQKTVQRYCERLARALAHVINILDPEVIVLGGGVSNTRSIYQLVPELWGEWVFSDQVETRLVQHKHGDSSGVRGAAWLWDM